MEWNKILYIDCMDKERGLPSLPDNSIEMAFTDPRYNVGYKGKGKRNDEQIYEDSISYRKYLKWCKEWAFELRRITRKAVMIHCGFPNMSMWVHDIAKPNGYLYHYKPDVQTGSSTSHLVKLTPILIYGALNKRFRINPIKARNSKDKMRGEFKCNCPLNRNLLMQILGRQMPESVIDPFMGSATTAFCCEKLGIKYIGYEIDKTLKSDYHRNLSQKGLNNFI